MKKVFIHIFAAVLVFTYVFSDVGFAVHKCKDSGSTDIISLLGDVLCGNIHEDFHSEPTPSHSCNSEDCASHTQNCCKTEIHNLSDEQDVKASLEFKKPLFPETTFLFMTSAIDPLNESYFSKINYYIYRGSPSVLLGSDKLSVISTWLL